jgi:hypothetical protein
MWRLRYGNWLALCRLVLATGPLATSCFRAPSLKSVPFWSDPNGTDLSMDVRKNNELHREESASKAGGSRSYGKIPRQTPQFLSGLAMGYLVTACFTQPSLKSVPFWSDPGFLEARADSPRRRILQPGVYRVDSPATGSRQRRYGGGWVFCGEALAAVARFLGGDQPARAIACATTIRYADAETTFPEGPARCSTRPG